MSTPTHKRLVRIIEQTLEQWLDDGVVEYAYDINCGMCDEFARSVIDQLGGETDDFRSCWLDERSHVAHCVIRLRDHYYDSECSKGVRDWRQIPVYLNRFRSRAEVLGLS